MPRIEVGRFFGREKLVKKKKKLHDLLEPGDDVPSVVVLQALGGQGKTQLALKYCLQWRKVFRGFFFGLMQALSQPLNKHSSPSRRN